MPPQPASGWRNGYIESFNSRVRDECLNINIFWSLTQARVVISDWKHEYNRHRPHSALGYQPQRAMPLPVPTEKPALRGDLASLWATGAPCGEVIRRGGRLLGLAEPARSIPV